MKVETEKSNNLYLYIDLPRFDFPVIFSELVRFLSVLLLHRLTRQHTGSCGLDLPATGSATCDACSSTSSPSGIIPHRPLHVGSCRSRHTT